jgi:anti-sigma regulatory factor (Ser/Thr protein kinase)
MEIGPALVSVSVPTDVAEARRRTADVARAIGFDEQASGRAALAVTEAATNLLKHAGGGEVVVGVAGDGRARGLQIVAMDKGGGIRELATSLRDGFSTAGTSGTGLGAIRRSTTTLDFHTGSGGTVLAATIYPQPASPLPVGAISVPATGERECGDAWAAWCAGSLTSIFVCDGLGHGRIAAQAARAAVDAFRRHAERPATEVLSAVHEAMRPTRGGAVAVAELDARLGVLQYCGIGNISAMVRAHDGQERHLVSLPGIAGHAIRRLQPFTYPWQPESLLVLHSDGVSSRWSLSAYPGLASRRPDVIAGVLLRDHRRGRDDATVVVVRHAGAP